MEDILFYFIASSEINVYSIFSHVNEYDIFTSENIKSMLFSLLILDYFGCLHCFTNRCRCRIDYLNSSDFSVSEQNYKVLVCIFIVRI